MAVGITALLCATAPALLNETAAQPSRAGVSAAVNGDVSRTPAAKPAASTPLVVGNDVFMQDQIKSAADSRAQLLLLDESSFTVGPNSEVVIDEFVYDPAANQGKLLAKVTRGTFRYVSGGIGRLGTDRAQIQTQISVIGIRGTIVLRDEVRDATGNLQEETIVLAGPGVKNNSNAKPGEITVASAGKSVTVARTGWGTIVRPGQPPTVPGPIDLAAIVQINNRLNAAALRAGQAGAPPPTDVRLESDETATKAAGQHAAAAGQAATIVQDVATTIAALDTVTDDSDLEDAASGGGFCCHGGFGIFNNLGQEVSDLAAVNMINNGTVSASATGLPLVNAALVSFTGNTTGGALEIPSLSGLPVLGTYNYMFTADLSTKTYTISAGGILFITGATGAISQTTTFPTSGPGFLDFGAGGPGVTHTNCGNCTLLNDLLTINGNPVGGIAHQATVSEPTLGTLFGAASLLAE
ncbi:MAG: FecR domain-containing protein [Alphaproteobacteria bacterium]|jgi:hypothetical protein|nr:FecR domain-containing protein [Alphaproteobacteria bacterium]